MELNLESATALLLQLAVGPGQSRYLDSQPLGESLPMNDSFGLLVRLYEQQVFQTDALRLSSYAVRLGGCPPADRLQSSGYWNAPHNPHLLAVSGKSGLAQASLRFLPVHPYGWEVEKLLGKPAPGDSKGSFVLQMLAPYLAPHSQAGLVRRAARYRVSVSLQELDISPLEFGLEFDLMSESWQPGLGETRVKYVPKP
jgi:hypothetical protein